jgi:hypothetical protein
MKTALHVLAAAALLAGCETKSPAWDKAGASEATVNEDTANCHSKARVAPSPHPAPPRSAYGASTELNADDARLRFEQEEFRRCMQEKGYNAKR